MTVERNAAGTSIRLILSAALVLSTPMGASAGSQFARAQVLTTPAPVVVPNFSLNASLEIPAALQQGSLSALNRHPVISLLNELQSKGVHLPDKLTTRADAVKLRSAAEALPEGPAKAMLISMAEAIPVSNSAGSAEAAQAQQTIFDGVQARAGLQEPVAPGRLERVRSFLGLSKKQTPAPEAKPANPADFKVKAEELRFVPADSQLPESTDKMPAGGSQIVGQESALKAVKFGLQMPGEHYNLFVSGSDGSGRETALREIAAEVAAKMPASNDTVAATNFKDPSKPIFLELPPGQGTVFAALVSRFVSSLKNAIPEMLQSKQTKEFIDDVESEMTALRTELENNFKEMLETKRLGDGKFGAGLDVERAREGKYAVYKTFDGKRVDPKQVQKMVEDQAVTKEELDKSDDEIHHLVKELSESFELLEKKSEELQGKVEATQRQWAQELVLRHGQSLLSMSHGKGEPTAEMKARVAEWMKDFQERLSKVDVEGYGLGMVRAKGGIGLIPVRDGRAVTDNDIAGEKTRSQVAELLARLREAAVPFAAELQEEMKREAGEMAALKKPLNAQQTRVAEYVEELLRFSGANYEMFAKESSSPKGRGGMEGLLGRKSPEPEEHFVVSVLADNGDVKGAPVVWVANPTYENIFGKAEPGERLMEVLGSGSGPALGGPKLKGGAIHQANGGFLVLNLMDVLREPGVWRALMAAVRRGTAEITEGGLYGLMTGKGATFEVPSKVKIVLLGSPFLYHLLAQQDDDFSLNFQSVAHFDSVFPLNDQSIAGYARFFKKAITDLGAKLNDAALSLTRDAMSQLIQLGARLAGSHEELTAQFGLVDGVIREAAFWARQAGRKDVRGEDVQAALQAKLEREEPYRRQILEGYVKNRRLVETTGAKVGQINGLAVMGSLGVVTRITVVPSASGSAPVVTSTDRQSNQTGPSFNKALGIVEGFLRNLFAQGRPLPVSLWFSYEQSYNGIDGDSATSTEIYGALSALSGVAIGQNFAVTGSADQFGNVQPIGGANEKIEGFFALCKARGLTGIQGVIIPR
ncbi:MAG: ATP-binding protein, partial [Elusimicrobiota bacterium]